MSNSNPGFFSDPKVIVSLLALLISIVSILWTLANQWEQNRRWDALNIGTIEFKEAKLYSWKELTKSEAFETNWGYDPFIVSSPDIYESFRLLYYLQLRDVTSGFPISRANPVFTIEEAQQELQRLKVEEPTFLVMLFRFIFIFENAGKTDVRDGRIEIDSILPNGSTTRVFSSNTPLRIPPAQSLNVSFDIGFPMSQELPEEMSFRITTSYIDLHGQAVDRESVISWESKRNYWVFGGSDLP